MRKHLLASAIALSLNLGGAAIAAQPYITAAMADSNRPAKDVALDADRHTAEIVEFTGVKPGDVVVDIIPGGGYWTRIFSKIVGPTGRVIEFVPAIVADKYEMGANANKFATDPAYGNITAQIQNIDEVKPTGRADVIFIRQNYHDYHTPFLGNPDINMVNAKAFGALKPGGTYLIIDHVAEAGSGVRDADSLHRIDPEQVKKEVTAAGFVFEGESTVARNTTDDHTKIVFDPSVRSHTDQFVYKFRKPG